MIGNGLSQVVISMYLAYVLQIGVTGLNVTEVCQANSHLATYVRGDSCFIYDHSQLGDIDTADNHCAAIKNNHSSSGYTSRLAWFDSRAAYNETMTSLLTQGMPVTETPYVMINHWSFMHPYVLRFKIGARGRSSVFSDLYWYADGKPITPVQPLVVHYIYFYGHTCIAAQRLAELNSNVVWKGVPCYNSPRSFVCEITSSTRPMVAYRPSSCIDHCNAIGGVRFGKSCFIIPQYYHGYGTWKQGETNCTSLGSHGVAGSVGRLAHFEEHSWNYFFEKLQQTPYGSTSKFFIGLYVAPGSTQPMWTNAEGKTRPASWHLLGTVTASTVERLYFIMASGIWKTTTYQGYRSICEIVCPTENIGDANACPQMPPPVKSVRIEYKPPLRTQNAIIETTCKDDYHKSHSNNPICVSDFGKLYWDDVMPKCERFTCGFDHEVSTSLVTVNYQGAYPFPLGTTARYRCRNNLRPSTGMSEINTRTCDLIPSWNYTQWNGPKPECSSTRYAIMTYDTSYFKVPCPELFVEHGTVSYSDASLVQGTRVTSLMCEAGHEPFQDDAICKDGQWSVHPVCKGMENWACPATTGLDHDMYTSSGCYWISNTTGNWTQAHAICKNEGGRLAALPASDIWQLKDNSFLNKLPSTKKSYWINAKQMAPGVFNEFYDDVTSLRNSIHLRPASQEDANSSCYLNMENKMQISNCGNNHFALCVNDTFYSQFRLIDKQCFNYPSIGQHQESSDRLCGMRCRSVEYCQSFTYETTTMKCTLHEAKPIDYFQQLIPSEHCLTGYMIG